MISVAEISIHHYFILSLALFFIGLFGVLFRKNILVVLMSVEIMLNAVNLTFISISQYYGSLDGQLIAFFVMTIAAAEAGVGLALAVQVYRRIKSINIYGLNQMKG